MNILGNGDMDDSWLEGNANGREDMLKEVLEKLRSDRDTINAGPGHRYTDEEVGILAYLNTLEYWIARHLIENQSNSTNQAITKQKDAT